MIELRHPTDPTVAKSGMIEIVDFVENKKVSWHTLAALSAAYSSASPFSRTDASKIGRFDSKKFASAPS